MNHSTRAAAELAAEIFEIPLKHVFSITWTRIAHSDLSAVCQMAFSLRAHAHRR